jgi:hypothetical protein
MKQCHTQEVITENILNLPEMWNYVYVLSLQNAKVKGNDISQ